MNRIVHVSDLHFGREQPELLAPLREAIVDARPDVVAVTGDLTQRARHEQFRAARAFLDGLGLPVMAVPGNHDVPLDRPFHRLFRPFARYRRHIAADLAPFLRRGALAVQGLNTADPFAWQRGRVRRRDLRRACARLREVSGVKVVMAHHPFEHAPDTDKTLMRRANSALDRLAGCDVQVILSGHLHRWRAEPFLNVKHGAQMLQVHVGTGLSTRRRGQGNDFAVLDLAPGEVRVLRMVAEGDDPAFRAGDDHRFVRGADGWQAVA